MIKKLDRDSRLLVGLSAMYWAGSVLPILVAPHLPWQPPGPSNIVTFACVLAGWSLGIDVGRWVASRRLERVTRR